MTVTPIRRLYVWGKCKGERTIMARTSIQDSLPGNQGEGLQKRKAGKRGRILVRVDEKLQTGKLWRAVLPCPTLRGGGSQGRTGEKMSVFDEFWMAVFLSPS